MTRKALIVKIYTADGDSGCYKEYVTEIDEENNFLGLKCIEDSSEIAIDYLDLQELSNFMRDELNQRIIKNG